MSITPKSFVAVSFLLTCCVAMAQTPQQDELANSAEQAAMPQVHLLKLEYADAHELAGSLCKIFDESIKAGHLVIVGDSRTKRLVIRSSDEVYCAVRDLVEELDKPDPASLQPADDSPSPSPQKESDSLPRTTDEQETMRRIWQDIKDSAKASDGTFTLQRALQEAVQRDFAAQQQKLRSELKDLRARTDALEVLLEKREAQKNTVIRRRFLTTLSELGTTALPSKDVPTNEPTSPATDNSLQGRDVCFVNDSDETILFTVVSGAERYEKRLTPRTHLFVTLKATVDDRVVLVQTVSDSDGKSKVPMRVVTTQSLAGNSAGRWNFCYVHTNSKESLSADLLGWVCLDIVPLDWQGTNIEDFEKKKSELIASLKSTTDADPAAESNLKKNLSFASGENASINSVAFYEMQHFVGGICIAVIALERSIAQRTLRISEVTF